MPKLSTITSYFETLTGDEVKSSPHTDFNILENGNELGYSQFNEVLLTLGFSRLKHDFFQFLVDGNTDYVLGASIKSIDHLEKSINRFSIIALLWYGNLKHAYVDLSQNIDSLIIKNDNLQPYTLKTYTKRHSPIVDIIPIPAEKTYLLGYISGELIQRNLNQFPTNIQFKSLAKEQKRYIEIGKKNQTSYLISDHLDVYIATSMREKHEFMNVNQLVKQIFNHRATNNLNLRYFDPTQAYCPDRIDKGLSEALMLKRAKLTIYFVQENDTLGKDSELASTLAQGKPVIAFVPKVNKKDIDILTNALLSVDINKSEKEIILDQLRIFACDRAWDKNDKINSWLQDSGKVKLKEMKDELYKAIKLKYDKRSETLKKSHPLGIQVNLNTGVANGVLVVRSISECARLVKAIVLNKMKFSVKKETRDNKSFIYLEENISKSIFRIQTGDRFLSNSFWNFYTNEI
jgi:hypothetical protein